ncbi:polysaccharide export outer membrane protein [Arcticibacter tournemirensis]|uniref:Polysaccharide export protein n=1 Tax=Arcticibacter tournemirensis TaxID=699437 RepID=A0A5M9HIC3_9SPHI|nr:polysaccharide biosynthesis/export family protein [Arcticibacter tournemirensis]KAA8486782.1 polysaccharide export protein [Arcticibacter tournemirensis]TQM49325.1 polysaccharide export outer membrane protein [Arcticibacter tournemirensis]
MNTTKHFSLLVFVAAILTFNSCSSYKNIPYFQNVNRSVLTREDIQNFSPLTIQPSDILGISVSSLNPQAWSDSSYRATGYLVDQQGEIKLPLIGKVKVSGLTTPVVGEQIQKRLLSYLKEPSVNVRVLNFKISVIGDVARPDVYKIPSERITITEALSMAGDLNITAKRNNLLLVRETDGKREYITLDLTSASVFHSPYYYLRNNDMIYVEPDKSKYASVDGSYRTLSLLLSAASIITVILTSVL